MTQPEILVIIPARGGSKGIPRKNLRKLAGVPLVVWAIRAALGAKLVTRTVVSTDDDEIAAVCRAAAAEVIIRPPELATDAAPTLPVLVQVLDAVEADEEFTPMAVVLLEPTSPFRLSRHVDACIEKLFSANTGSAVTVTQLERNPQFIFSVNGDAAERYIKEPVETFTQRDQFRHLKRLNGCVYATWTENIRAGRLVTEPFKIVEMSPEESVNIDTLLDFTLAELCAERL
ncbi:MAG: acylneuraminate cytidylyltransferase family protein, partial [Alphaproteobacteria bacterium]|nr:acylneuraminate cytidylyltransferase family protein [Alphaproteobacteria bacterium]